MTDKQGKKRQKDKLTNINWCFKNGAGYFLNVTKKALLIVDTICRALIIVLISLNPILGIGI